MMDHKIYFVLVLIFALCHSCNNEEYIYTDNVFDSSVVYSSSKIKIASAHATREFNQSDLIQIFKYFDGSKECTKYKKSYCYYDITFLNETGAEIASMKIYEDSLFSSSGTYFKSQNSDLHEHISDVVGIKDYFNEGVK